MLPTDLKDYRVGWATPGRVARLALESAVAVAVVLAIWFEIAGLFSF